MVPLFLVAYRVFALALAPIGGSLSLLLLFACQSQEGAAFAVGALLFSLVPLLDLIARERESRLLSFVAVVALAGWVAITAWLFTVAPDGRSPATARVQNRYVKGDWHYPRAALGNLLPELDQILLGLKIMPALDSHLTQEQSRQTAPITAAIYRELEADPDFHALGSVLPHAYDELWGQRIDHGHYFLYVPKNLDRQKPAPALVFLHGSGGNFKAYTWLLAKVADERGLVLISPTYGFGNWQEPDTTKTVKAVLKDAAKLVQIDPAQRHLIGLSNGGLGLCQAGMEIGEQFRSLIFLSPVMDREAMSTPKFSRRWKDRPILILTGQTDDRVPLESVTAAATQMRKQGAQVTLESIPTADHFLLFTHRDQVLNRLSTWLKNLPPPPPDPEGVPNK
ncbi:MAG: prolyl oligopeptidase family serine peptidase [Prosthecobacter sp.]|nr:prolyl oligopeptidase family serine peptidase [Prosthecobacter sp.]